PLPAALTLIPYVMILIRSHTLMDKEQSIRLISVVLVPLGSLIVGMFACLFLIGFRWARRILLVGSILLAISAVSGIMFSRVPTRAAAYLIFPLSAHQLAGNVSEIALWVYP